MNNLPVRLILYYVTILYSVPPYGFSGILLRLIHALVGSLFMTDHDFLTCIVMF